MATRQKNTAAALLCSPGEAGLPQALQEGAVTGPVPRLPEAVHVSGADPSAGAPEAPQRALPQQNPGQQPRVEVSVTAKISKCKSVRLASLKTTAYLCVCVWLQGRVAVAAGSQLPGRIGGDGPRRPERSTSPPAGPARRHPRPDGAHQHPRKPGQRLRLPRLPGLPTACLSLFVSESARSQRQR